MSAELVHAAGQIIEHVDDDAFSLRVARKPEAMVAEAAICANALLAAVRKNAWAQKFGNKEHLFFEAWSFLSSMYRVTPRIRETRLVQIGDVIGYEAFAEAFHVPSQTVISTAEAMCLNDEDNWSLRAEYEWQGPKDNRQKVRIGEKPVPLFQLRSMAQTRAMAKALKGPFSWVVAMAGYAPRPAEEMGPDPTGAPPQGQSVKQPQRDTTGKTGSITEPQQKRFYALAKAANKTDDEIKRILQHFGFASTKDITWERYDEICAEVQRGDGQ
jgi:hypothetical protein